jgi:O-acetyl-ADP-ribose deacetylase (regulator of RNase III)
MMDESRLPRRPNPEVEENLSDLRLEGAKLAMLQEYEDRGDIDVGLWIEAYPDWADELLDYAIWMRGTPKLAGLEDSVWTDDDGVALAALQTAASSVRRTEVARTAIVASVGRWTNHSVLALAGDRDPIEVITESARAIVVEAIDKGWSGPPFDPIALADLLNLRVVGSSDIRDARIVPLDQNVLQIEFNPNRPPARVRYSVAHEIAHTLFPDCGELVRNRAAREEMVGDEWQLETLCNIAAAEFLMPVGTLPHLVGEELAVDRLVAMRKEFQVSAEALFIRVARLAGEPCAAFCATRLETGEDAGRYRVDYSIPSQTWGVEIPRATFLPLDTRVSECTAIGYTAKFSETWWSSLGEFYVECVGISPYPGANFPRVVGLVRSDTLPARESCITYLFGDATCPSGPGPKIIAHIVNDATPRWGAGFPLAIRKKWEHVQEEFLQWVGEDRKRLRLGNVHAVEADEETVLVHMVAQHGYGASAVPGIRYSALGAALQRLASFASQRHASIHMPRIGTGQAGGNWALIEELIVSSLCVAGIQVFVYDLPGTSVTVQPQLTFDL